MADDEVVEVTIDNFTYTPSGRDKKVLVKGRLVPSGASVDMEMPVLMAFVVNHKCKVNKTLLLQILEHHYLHHHCKEIQLNKATAGTKRITKAHRHPTSQIHHNKLKMAHFVLLILRVHIWKEIVVLQQMAFYWDVAIIMVNC